MLDTWTQKANFDGAARFYASCFSMGNKGYVGTGINQFDVYKDLWEYNSQTDSWTQKSDLVGDPRFWSLGFSIGSKGYIGTGTGVGLNKDLWQYNPSSDSWTQKADLPGSARAYAIGFAINGKGFIGTGLVNVSTDECTNDIWEYDPLANSWSQKANFPSLQHQDGFPSYSGCER